MMSTRDRDRYREMLESASGYEGIFRVVRESVYEYLGVRRSGLSLVLRDMPTNVLGYHVAGSNFIVLNRRIFKAAERMDRRIFNSLAYVVLLHEYLHSLGFLDESIVREYVRRISEAFFGRGHPVYRFSVSPYNEELVREAYKYLEPEKWELIREFDYESRRYIL